MAVVDQTGPFDHRGPGQYTQTPIVEALATGCADHAFRRSINNNKYSTFWKSPPFRKPAFRVFKLCLDIPSSPHHRCGMVSGLLRLLRPLCLVKFPFQLLETLFHHNHSLLHPLDALFHLFDTFIRPRNRQLGELPDSGDVLRTEVHTRFRKAREVAGELS